MSPPPNQIDAKLDEWGSRLFNVSTETLPRPRRSMRSPLGSAKSVSTGGRLSTPQARATYVRQKLQALVRRAPQVVVKLVRAPKGMKGISNNLTYISRDGLALVLLYFFVRAAAGRCSQWQAGWLHLAAGAATECAALCNDGAGESGWYGTG